MFDLLGRGIARRPGWVVAGWLLVGIIVTVLAPPWEERCQDDDIHFMPDRFTSVRGHRLLEEAFPQDVFGSKLILALERPDESLTPADYRLIDRISAEILALRREKPELTLGPPATYRDPLIGVRLQSRDRRCTLVVVPMETPVLGLKTGVAVKKVEARVLPIFEEYRQSESAAGRRVALASTGPSAIGRDLNDAVYQSLDDTTVATVALVIVILLLVYRSPLLALVPLTTIGGSVYLSLKLLALLTLWPGFQVVNITEIFIVVVLFGAGTDYCLFLISRYREELEAGDAPAKAIRQSLRRVGGALTASAGTVMVGLGMMGFAEFAKLRYCGPAIALSLGVALLASLTLAPALLRLCGRRVFWPNSPKRRPASAANGELDAASGNRFWQWLSGRIAAFPLRIWLATTALLLPLALLGWRTEHVFDVCGELPIDASSRKGLDMIRRHFTAGEMGPVTVLLESQREWTEKEQRELIARLSAELGRLDNVAEVRSLTQPLGPGAAPPAGLPGLAFFTDSIADKIARGYYVSRSPRGHVTRIDVVFHTEPFAPESTATFQELRGRLEAITARLGDAAPRVEWYGITPLNADFAEVHHADRLRVNSLVLAGILLILVAVVRRPLVAVYLLVTVLFSYYATLGFTEIVSWFWFGSPIGAVDWKVPYFLFTILVAVGEDYNIFLMSRVMEESKTHGCRRGVQRALARTGSIITSCGLIMAGTFAAMMLCRLQTLTQLGLALAFGVLLETFVVRPILVPAMLLAAEHWRRLVSTWRRRADRQPPDRTLIPENAPATEVVRPAA